MHTTEGPKGTIFHHSGDFTGAVEIVIHNGKVTYHSTGVGTGDRHAVIEVPFEDILALVAARLRSQAISTIEGSDDEEVFRLAWLWSPSPKKVP